MRWAAPMVAVSMMVVSACGDSDGGSAGSADSSASSVASSSSTSGQGPSVAGVCEAFFGLTAAFGAEEPPDFEVDVAPRLDVLEADAPAAIEADVAVMVAAGRSAVTGDTAAFETEAFMAAKQAVDAFAFEECPAVSRIDIEGADFAFTGFPEAVPAGVTLVRLTNASTAGEAHEALILRRNDGVTDDFADILALPMEQAQTKATVVGSTFAPSLAQPGVGSFDLEPGDYTLVCFVPQGASPEHPDGTGPAHAELGMVHEFRVE